MKWSSDEKRIVAAAVGLDAAVAALHAAGYARTRCSVADKWYGLGRRAGREHSLAWMIPSIWPRHNQAAARRVAAFIEENSPMTLQQYEAGMRKLEAARE